MPRFIYVTNAPPFMGRTLVFVRMKPNFGTKLTGRCSLATNFKILSWWGAIYATKIYGNFGLKLKGPVWSNRKSFEKVGPLFSVGPVPIKVDRFRLFLNRSTSPSGTFHVQHGGRHLSWLLLWILYSGSVGFTRTSTCSYNRSAIESQAKPMLALLTAFKNDLFPESGMFFSPYECGVWVHTANIWERSAQSTRYTG